MATKNTQYLESLNFRQLRKLHSPSTKEEYMQLQAMAKEGPLFSAKTLGLVHGYDELPKPLTKWVGLYLERNGTYPLFVVASLVRDWVNAVPEAAKQIETMTTDRQLVDAATDWHDATFKVQKTGQYITNNVVAEFADGFAIVEITDQKDLKTEGNLMGHCVGQYWSGVQSGYTKIYSLRDASNQPHVTIEVRLSSPFYTQPTVTQCYGKQNQYPVLKYHPYLIDWFTRNEYWSGFVVGKLPLPEDKYAQAVNDTANYHYLESIIQNCTYPKVLAKLAHSKNTTILRCVAENPHTPIPALVMLAQSPNPIGPVDPASTRTGRYPGYYGRDYTLDFRENLARSNNAMVRESVAGNPATPERVLEGLQADPDIAVRFAVVSNYNFYGFVNLKNDPCPEIRNKVRERIRNGHLVKAPILYQLRQYENNFVAHTTSKYYDYRPPPVVIKKKTWEQPKMVRC